ncbi:hypothetical protein BJF83_04495 [Nocardiopsis sp. CNR-923]|uniref:hypothetical protein n=1 Tax=Nocardiopsis sp. CNR-923 TaxID=1904965 RepID=UPI00096880A9|nr:hypothetical protein [Nocardiopsis sp. CNR-923]OLT26115.1 hypothetical protein BJF83_04495 [Nocardiopsis sp. CNR-923]
MTQVKRTSARTLVLAAGTAGFVALGAGISGADVLESSARQVAPVVERALVEGVAPTMRGLAPDGAVPIADAALSELQRAAHDPAKPAPDLSAPLPESGRLVTPVGEFDSPLPAARHAVAGVQDATGLDGDPHHTVGHAAGDSVADTAQDAGDSLEDTGGMVEGTARDAGGRVERSAGTLLPHTVHAAHELKDELDVPSATDLTRMADPSQLPRPADLAGGGSLPLDVDSSLTDGSDLPRLTDLTNLTGENTLALSDVVDLGEQLGGPSGTVHQRSAAPALPNVWDMAYVFGLETPKQAQDLVESNPVTDDNYVDLGEGEILGMVGQRNMEDPLAVTVAQSSPGSDGLGDGGGLLPQMPKVTEIAPLPQMPQVTEIAELPDLAEGGLPRVAEGADTQTVDDLFTTLGQGPSALGELDTSDLVSIEGGGPAQAPASDDGMVHHPTFTDLPGHEALPAVS